MFYSKSTRGFYLPEIHGDNIPEDVVEITDDDHRALIEGQNDGKQIVPDADGRPILIDPAPPSDEQRLAASRLNRAVAYREESDPLFFKAQRGEATMDEWLAKIADIKARYPE